MSKVTRILIIFYKSLIYDYASVIIINKFATELHSLIYSLLGMHVRYVTNIISYIFLNCI